MTQRHKGFVLMLLLGALAYVVVNPPIRPANAAAKASTTAVRQFPSQLGTVSVETVTSGLENPWSLAFLPDGRMLVTERTGQMRIVNAAGRKGAALTGLPKVSAKGQGGLLDVVLSPDFAQNSTVFFSYSEPRQGGNGTAVAKARLALKGDGGSLENVQVIFRQQPTIDSGAHFGSRLVFARDGNLFVTLGDRYSGKEQAPLKDNHLGKVVRITTDGSAPKDNPFVNAQGAKPELWSVGHRNPQGAALHPVTGQLWITEHGPKGGDEVNAPKPGLDYGWPQICYCVNYDDQQIGTGKSELAGLQQPLWHWTPSIAPSGLAFYTADRFPGWRGNLFAGSLKFGLLSRLTLDGENVVGEERLLEGLNQRIRDVRQGPDGALYLLTDEGDGSILRVTLAEATKV
ncbi:MAG: PQQ-dependent sugar dehydrogenase [Stagnimonas sp.]|nr:PQQ-dependent sugar dehydrogenase [Stagnimonas sp.]